MVDDNTRSIRAVYDCNIFVQAALDEDGPAFACLLLAESGSVELAISAEVLDEVHSVLNRPKLRRRYRQLTQDRIDAFLDRVAQTSKLIPVVNRVFIYERDPKDQLYVDLADTVAATHLVSRDRDLLDLMTVQTPVGRDFRQRFPHLLIVDPVGFLDDVRGSMK
jgi:putative PIN family toxin of toxin-antitoxin system